jgi:hypothetical protein
MGVVVLAKDRRLGREVVIKTAIGSSSLAEELCARAQREAQALAQVRHPNLLEVYEAEIGPQGSYLVMEYVRGRPLSEVPPNRDWRGVFRQVAAALAALHQAGLVHRDVKPANILEEEGGRVVLIDLGLVRDERATAITRTGVVVGTIGFMAPEVLKGAAPSPASDWFAWAVSFFQCLTRRMPYGSTELIAHVTQGAPLECDLQEVPGHLRDVLARYLSADPGERHAPPELPPGAATEAVVLESRQERDIRPSAREPAPTVVLGVPETTRLAMQPPLGRVTGDGRPDRRPLVLLLLLLLIVLVREVRQARTAPRPGRNAALARLPRPTADPGAAPPSSRLRRSVPAEMSPAPSVPSPTPPATGASLVPQSVADRAPSSPAAPSDPVQIAIAMDIEEVEKGLASRLQHAEKDWAAGRFTGAFRGPLSGDLEERLAAPSRRLGPLLEKAEVLDARSLRLLSLASFLGVLGYGDPGGDTGSRVAWQALAGTLVRPRHRTSREWKNFLAQFRSRRWRGASRGLDSQRVTLPPSGPGGLILTLAARGVRYLRVEGGGVRLLLPGARGSWILDPRLTATLGSELAVFPGPATGPMYFYGYRVEVAGGHGMGTFPAPGR